MTDAPHPSTDLDDTVHQRVRLGILTVLTELRRADFGTVKRLLALSDGNLNRHLDVLAGQQLVTITKEPVGARTHTWIALTPAGRTALEDEMYALGELMRRYESARAQRPTRAPRVRTAAQPAS